MERDVSYFRSAGNKIFMANLLILAKIIEMSDRLIKAMSDRLVHA